MESSGQEENQRRRTFSSEPDFFKYDFSIALICRMVGHKSFSLTEIGADIISWPLPERLLTGFPLNILLGRRPLSRPFRSTQI